MKVLIYGCGAVGLGIASCLLKSKTDLDVITRKNTVNALGKNGLVRTGIFGGFSAAPEAFGSFTSLNEIKVRKYDYILVCTKSFDSEAAAKNLAEFPDIFSENTKIVLFQNGWGNAEKFLPHFDKNIIYNARVITGFTREKENHVIITVHADSIHIGSLFAADLSDIEELCEAINTGDIPCESTADIEKDLWAKMLYNCALNGLGAILGVPYGTLAEYEHTRKIMNGIVEEIFAVLQQANYKTYWQRPADFLHIFYNRLIPDTAKHKSSTLQDLAAKKRTEIDALNGAVVELATRHSIHVPYNQTIYNMVKFIEAQSS
jgi:2-dehydropantoate 2-reductase